jgi:hypothetical protein
MVQKGNFSRVIEAGSAVRKWFAISLALPKGGLQAISSRVFKGMVLVYLG